MPPVINEEKCIKCNKCAEICSEDVFYGSKKRGVPNGDLSQGVCPF